MLNPGTDREVVQGGSYNLLEAGEVLVNDTGGGGGGGNPLEREPERVAHDVRNGYVSTEAAARELGVVVDPETFEVDAAATERRRQAPVCPTHVPCGRFTKRLVAALSSGQMPTRGRTTKPI